MTIRLPILRKVTVTGYGLFRNETSNSIDHAFAKGVSLIVGINGLGKTTLLNMLYRALLGPRDMSKRDTDLSSSQHELVGWRTPRLFRARVQNEAVGASIQVSASFGDKLLTIKRSLRTLEVESLELDGVPEPTATQDRYEELARDLSGVATFFDFAAILRFLIFFLEDRPELVWDQRSQFDMLRLLFYDREAARGAADAYDAAQRADSAYRNRRVPVRAAQDQLKRLEEAERTGVAHEMRAIQVALNAARDADQDDAQLLIDERLAEDGARLRREKALLDLDEARRECEREQQLHYAHVFPDIGETASHVFLNLLGGGGCLVCGDRSAAAETRVREFTERGRCPVCESVPARQERVVQSGEFNARRLQRLAAKVTELRSGVEQHDALLAEARDAVSRLVSARAAAYENIRAMEARLSSLRQQVQRDVAEFALASDDQDRSFLEETVRKGEADLNRHLADRAQEEARYKSIKDGQATALAVKIVGVKAAFRRIAGNLLAEACELGDEETTRTIGQEGERIAFPVFKVRMTSGAFTGTLNDREEADSVSESQREFVELAFRMALMEVAASGGDAMLVMETPEASLDSLFVKEAGALFRQFAAGGGVLGNVFIASTNLNDEGMIAALLGVDDPLSPEPEPQGGTRSRRRPPARPLSPGVVPVAERASRLINLLELAAPNAALRRHGRLYREKLSAAVYKDIPEAERPDLTGMPAGQLPS